MKQCRKCRAPFKSCAKINGKLRNIGNRKFCLVCVPYGSKAPALPRPVYHNCSLCGKKNGSSRRKRCASCNTKIRRFRTKAAAVALMGGKCQNPTCGWVGPQSGYSFHHLGGKDFTIGTVSNKSWDSIKTELKKCVLLCVRCHALEHSSREDAKLIAEAAKYQGRELVW